MYVKNFILSPTCDPLEMIARHHARNIFMYRPLQELPCNIQQLFSKDKNAQCKPRQIGANFNHKYARTELKTRCVSIFGVKLWNELGKKITALSCIYKFKSEVKKFLLHGWSLR